MSGESVPVPVTDSPASWLWPGAKAALVTYDYSKPRRVKPVTVLRVGKRDVVLDGSPDRPRVRDLHVPSQDAWATTRTLLHPHDAPEVAEARRWIRAESRAYKIVQAAEALREDPNDRALVQAVFDLAKEALDHA